MQSIKLPAGPASGSGCTSPDARLLILAQGRRRSCHRRLILGAAILVRDRGASFEPCLRHTRTRLSVLAAFRQMGRQRAAPTRSLRDGPALAWAKGVQNGRLEEKRVEARARRKAVDRASHPSLLLNLFDRSSEETEMGRCGEVARAGRSTTTRQWSLKK
jgi:hypothetical protein